MAEQGIHIQLLSPYSTAINTQKWISSKKWNSELSGFGHPSSVPAISEVIKSQYISEYIHWDTLFQYIFQYIFHTCANNSHPAIFLWLTSLPYGYSWKTVHLHLRMPFKSPPGLQACFLPNSSNKGEAVAVVINSCLSQFTEDSKKVNGQSAMTHLEERLFMLC